MNKQPKILVVDDDPAILYATRRVLEQAGYETLGAQDGQEALELTRAQRPDLLLLDVNMPKMDGFEVCRRIKVEPALTGTFIIIMSSARDDSESQVDGLNMGADGYIARPVANRELLARVQAMLRIQAGERAWRASNAQWSATFDAVSDAILLTDASYTILKCNQAASEMWQRPPEALVGKKCYAVVHGAETPVSACPLALVCETKSRQILTFTQNERWLEAKVDPIFDANGNFNGTVHVIADITERKQAEEMLKESKERFATIFRANPAAIAITRFDDGRLVDVNEAWQDITGYLYAEAVDHTHLELNLWVNPEQRERLVEMLRVQAKARGEMQLRRKSGEVRDLLMSAESIELTGKRYLLTMAQDITERKQAEAALRESEDRYRRLTEAITDYIYTVRVEQGCALETRHSAGCVAVTGYTVEEFAADPYLWYRMIWPEDRQLVEDQIRRLLAGQEAPAIEHRITRKNGAVRWIYNTLSPHFNKRHELVSYDGLIQDITARKRAEDALRESEERFHVMFEKHDAIMLLIEPQTGLILDANQGATKFYGYPKSKLCEMSINDINTLPPERVAAERQKALNEERNYFIFSHKLASGEERSVEVHSSPIPFQEKQVLFSIIHDITARKQADEALRENEENLRALLDAILESVLLIKTDGTVVATNQTTAERLHSTVEQMTGRNVYDFVSPDVAEVRRKYVEQVIATGQPICFEDQRNGRTVFNSIAPVLDAGRRVERLAIFGFDITERKQAEEVLRNSETRLRAILDATPFPIALVDVQDEKIDFWSSSALTLFGHTAPTVAEWYQIAYPDLDYQREVIKRWKPALEKARLSIQAINTGEYKVVCSDGSVRICELYAAFLANSLIVTFNDITERKQAEDALRESEEKYRRLFENTSLGIFQSTPEGKAISVNLAFARMFGYDFPADALNSIKNVATDVFADPNRRVEIIRLMAENPGLRTFENIYRRKDGSTFIGTLNSMPVMDANGDLIRIEGIIEDITERKRAEEKIRETQMLLQASVESPKDMLILSIDKNYQYLYFNSVHENIMRTAYGKEVKIGMNLLDCITNTDDRRRAKINYDRALNGFSHVTTEEYGDLERYYYETRYNPIYNDNKEIIGATAFSANITERKQAEEALKESKLLFHLLIESLPQNIYAKDVYGRFTFANQRYCTTQGSSLEEIVGKTDFELHPPELAEKYRADDRQVMETGKAIELEEEHQPVGGEKSFVQVIKTPFYDSKGQTAGTLGIFWDITARKQIEEALKEYNTRLETAVEERTHELRETQEKLVRQEKLAVLGQLAGSVGHELRNPLGIINNAIYYLRLVQPDAQAKVKEYLGIIETETHNADKIINDLLDFSRIKSVDVEPVAVADLLRHTLERFPVPENIQVTLTLPEDLPSVYVDPRQMTQVLGNLVVNACQAMLKGGELRVSSEQRTESSEQAVKTDPLLSTPLISNNPSSALRTDWLLITIKDTGSGITPENMKKLFEPLFTTKPKGIGLGLAVSQKLVEANGGRIEVESEPGVGSTFTVYLPVSKKLG